MVSEHAEDKTTKAVTPQGEDTFVVGTIRIELHGEHKARLERVARAYGLEPDELFAYFCEREELAPPDTSACSACRMTQDRNRILNQRIMRQRRALRQLNRAIRMGSFGAGKVMKERARLVLAGIDRTLHLGQEYHSTIARAVERARSAISALVQSDYDWRRFPTDIDSGALDNVAPIDWR